MSAVRVGDRVRVTVEGTCTFTHKYVDDDRFDVALDCGPSVCLPASVSVEILTPPVKVGDVIDTAEQLDALPLWTVVRENASDVFSDVFRRYTTGWYAAVASTEPSTPQPPATVLYLPDGAA